MKSREADRIIDIRDGHFDSERSLMPIKAIAAVVVTAALAWGASEAVGALEDLADNFDKLQEQEETPSGE